MRGDWAAAEAELAWAASELATLRPPLAGYARARLAELRRRQGRPADARGAGSTRPRATSWRRWCGRRSRSTTTTRPRRWVTPSATCARFGGDQPSRAPRRSSCSCPIRIRLGRAGPRRTRPTSSSPAIADAVGTDPLRAAERHAAGRLALAERRPTRRRRALEDADRPLPAARSRRFEVARSPPRARRGARRPGPRRRRPRAGRSRRRPTSRRSGAAEPPRAAAELVTPARRPKRRRRPGRPDRARARGARRSSPPGSPTARWPPSSSSASTPCTATSPTSTPSSASPRAPPRSPRPPSTACFDLTRRPGQGRHRNGPNGRCAGDRPLADTAAMTTAQDSRACSRSRMRPLHEAALDDLLILDGSPLLDVGCGAGSPRAGRPAGARAAARRRPHRHRRDRPGGCVGDWRRCPSDDTFAVVTVFDAFRFTDDGCPVAPGGGRVARPGAPVVLATWGPPDLCEAAAYLRAMAALLRTDLRRARPLRVVRRRRPRGVRRRGRADARSSAARCCASGCSRTRPPRSRR